MKKTFFFILFASVLMMLSACRTRINIPLASAEMDGVVTGTVYVGRPFMCTGTVPLPFETPVILPTPTHTAPLAGTAVKLIDNNGVVVVSTVSAADGTFTFTGVAPGDGYIVECFYPGYEWVPGFAGRVDGANSPVVDIDRMYFYQPGVLWVKMKDTVGTFEQAMAALSVYGCTEYGSLSSLFNSTKIIAVRFPNDKTLHEMEQILEADSSVAYTERSTYACPY